MKYITFAVPCYNSENYMRRCVDSLLIGGKDVEIILIDDGSSDRTAQIADEYEIEYPDIVRVVHKENGGHGSGVNKGLELANGIYYKVVDSDDWFDKESYQKLLVNDESYPSSSRSLYSGRYASASGSAGNYRADVSNCVCPCIYRYISYTVHACKQRN